MRYRPSKSSWSSGGSPKARSTTPPIRPHMVQPDPPQAYRRPVPIMAVAFNQDGQQLAASGYHEVTVWTPAGVLARRISNVAERTYSLNYSPDGSLLAV